jgi:hypothetical protein
MSHRPPKPALLEIDLTPKPPRPPGPFDRILENQQWRAEAEKLLSLPSVPNELSQAFHTTWTVEGRQIREQVNDDLLVAALLRHMLPKYAGGEIDLYRGENIDRFERGITGFCWTSLIDTAETFAQGLNATRKGGLLLSVRASPAWIIAGPSAHSVDINEHEYTVQPQLLKGVVVVRRYPSSDPPGERLD